VSALTIVLVAEFEAVGLLIVGRETVDAGVVLVAGVVDVGTVTLGRFTGNVVVDVKLGLVADVVVDFGVVDVVSDVRGTKVVLGVEDKPSVVGALTTLLKAFCCDGALLPDLRLFRIAIFMPSFLTWKTIPRCFLLGLILLY